MADNTETESANQQIQALEMQIAEHIDELRTLQKAHPGKTVKNYTFDTLAGPVHLLDLFAHQEDLLVIHNMGQGCRYCTLWADGINGMLTHLESSVAVVLVSKDSPELQRKFANSRGWRMRTASHGGGDYMHEQVIVGDVTNMPGAVHYQRQGDTIVQKARTCFGPGDLYCSLWHFMGLLGQGLDDFTPQFNYWVRPAELEDGGANVVA